MYAYPDSKCTWGYMYVCHVCQYDAPDHVDLTVPILEPIGIKRRIECELCKVLNTVHAPLSLINTLSEFLGVSLRTGGKAEVLKFLSEYRQLNYEDKQDMHKMLMEMGYRIRSAT